MALRPDQIPPDGLDISKATAGRWRALGCDFSSAVTTLAWAEEAVRSGKLRIKTGKIDQLKFLCTGEPAHDSGGCVGVGGVPESIDFDEAAEMGIEEAVALLKRDLAVCSGRLKESYSGGTEADRALRRKAVLEAAEALRKLETSAGPILEKQGRLWRADDVRGAIASAFGRVRMALDGLVARHPELAGEIEATMAIVAREPMLDDC